ncbi:hypothetical protein [Rossellomorea aquimaris]|uniref:hypothetical protein n=1 Tax=Rossellomorea aquimaris TaxID=189382 RepID=UPI0007D07CEA|nr:hypothetical protein [Rossellomorea aquimaris]
MKKLLPFMLLMSLFMAACNNEKSNTEKEEMDTNKETTESTEVDEMAVNGALLDLQMNVIKTVNEHDSAIYDFESAKAKEEDKPSDEELATMKSDAESAATTIAEDIRTLEVPAELESQKEEIEAGLEELAKSYETRAANLSDEANAEYKESDDLFASFEEKMSNIYEATGLTSPSFSADIVD